MEWKLDYRQVVHYGAKALETSLVEWKRNYQPNYAAGVIDLGNFLSGMETNVAKRAWNPFTTLETSLVEWKR